MTVRRLSDIVLSLVLLFVCLPAFALAGAAIWLDAGAPLTAAEPSRKAMVPEFLIEMVLVPVLPRFTVPNLTGDGARVNCEPAPVPAASAAACSLG